MKIMRYDIINAFFSDTSIANSLMSYTSTTQATEHNGPQHKKSVRPTSLTKCQAQYLSPQGVWERGFFFVCVVSFLFVWFLFCLRGFSFVCVVSVLFAWFLFACVVSVLLAWFLFCLRGFFFIWVASILCAWFLFCLPFPFLFAWFLFCLRFLFFCLRGFFFVCLVPFLFAWFLFCLRVSFFVCVFSFLFAACPLWAIVLTGGGRYREVRPQLS